MLFLQAAGCCEYVRLNEGNVAAGSGSDRKPVFVAARDIVDPAKCGFLNKKTRKSVFSVDAC